MKHYGAVVRVAVWIYMQLLTTLAVSCVSVNKEPFRSGRGRGGLGKGLGARVSLLVPAQIAAQEQGLLEREDRSEKTSFSSDAD